ncbi:ATP-dependent nuclease [Nocardioides bruguierae]|uniref:ATP-dependent nuclease n=1 Tax=Nocardioides bruguierae TaxID=2945102 RepID=UPI00201FF384|nr:ATP-binding protein [Nocardioides bruguierae]MCL8026461.1 ATP-binding protein [Nocardioides bruguierae]
MQIRRIDIENFRGVRELSWRLPADQTFYVLIGPGDATKSTILTALERALSDRWNITFTDTDFYDANIDTPIRIRVAVTDLPPDLLAIDELGLHLAGIDKDGDWSHDAADGHDKCVIVELLVDADLEPQWTLYRPDADEGEEQHTLKTRHRARFGAFRVDERVDAHLRWSRMSALGKLTEKKSDTKRTLTEASRAASKAASKAVPEDLQELADDIAVAVRAIGSAEFDDLKPGLDLSLNNAQGNLALFDGPVPLTNFGLGTRRLAGAATQQLAHEDSTILLVDEVEYGLEPHRLVHLLRHLQKKDAFAQVFVTTHSPTALQHLHPNDLMMVRSTGGKTEVRSLGAPDTLKPVIKASPEAFLARRVVLCEGKTEYGLLLALLNQWNDERERNGALPAAALGVVGVEGNGGTGTVAWTRELLAVGYDVVAVLDSDDASTNALVPAVVVAGGKVVQWPGDVCTEQALCDQLEIDGLTAFVAAAVAAAEDPETAASSYASQLQSKGAPTTGEPLEVKSWLDVGLSLTEARGVVGMTAKKSGWFKNVDRGKVLAEFVLGRHELQTGPVATAVASLREQVYLRHETGVAHEAETEARTATDPADES